MIDAYKRLEENMILNNTINIEFLSSNYILSAVLNAYEVYNLALRSKDKTYIL